MVSRTFETPEKALAHLHALGFLYPDATQGFQYDAVSAFKPTDNGKVTQGSLCGFNCTSDKGAYSCGMAWSQNRGVSKSTFASADFIVEKCRTVEAGLDLVRNWFLHERMDRFCRELQISNINIQDAIRRSFETRRTEANLFGGDPEQHPQIIEIIRRLKALGMKVNLTATGSRWMNDPAYVEQLLANPPNVICVSLDEMTVTEFLKYSRMPLPELKSTINAMDKQGDHDHGQAKKALAGFYVARYMKELPGGPPAPLLFNCVLSPRNIHWIPEISFLVEKEFPGSILNPYPGQGSFNYEEPEVNIPYLQALEHFVDAAIQKTLKGGKFVKRLHYWLVLKAIYNVHRGDWATIARRINGYGVWTCYEEPMAGFYVQPARSSAVREPKGQVGRVIRPENVDGYPGGYLGCSWNTQTVTESDQISTPEGVADHILGGMTVLAGRSENPCEGCLMPRLMFDFTTTFLGLKEDLRNEVIRLRQQYAGF